jgi:hypothetical protein
MRAFNRKFDTLALAAIAVLVTLAAARASEETVDQATKTALSLEKRHHASCRASAQYA